uniref:Myosin phosphatase Rho interacting protein n=1 Tax=Macaca nemestrina TaxID=9545 RepID=A0A2K6CX14_MACNE
MSAAKGERARAGTEFQANIFNKSKCQNCFKPRESHLLNDEDLTQQNTHPLEMKHGAHVYDA